MVKVSSTSFLGQMSEINCSTPPAKPQQSNYSEKAGMGMRETHFKKMIRMSALVWYSQHRCVQTQSGVSAGGCLCQGDIPHSGWLSAFPAGAHPWFSACCRCPCKTPELP